MGVLRPCRAVVVGKNEKWFPETQNLIRVGGSWMRIQCTECSTYLPAMKRYIFNSRVFLHTKWLLHLNFILFWHNSLFCPPLRQYLNFGDDILLPICIAECKKQKLALLPVLCGLRAPQTALKCYKSRRWPFHMEGWMCRVTRWPILWDCALCETFFSEKC